MLSAPVEAQAELAGFPVALTRRAPQRQNADARQMADSPKHLLLVEDEAPLREAVAEQLSDRGFTVVQADSAERALESLADFAFDIVITDLRLPGLDGTRVIEAAVDRY